MLKYHETHINPINLHTERSCIIEYRECKYVNVMLWEMRRQEEDTCRYFVCNLKTCARTASGIQKLVH